MALVAKHRNVTPIGFGCGTSTSLSFPYLNRSKIANVYISKGSCHSNSVTWKVVNQVFSISVLVLKIYDASTNGNFNIISNVQWPIFSRSASVKYY